MVRLSSTPVRKGEMLSRQSELPRLPVPPLKDTIDRYLKSVKPFLNDAEMATTKKVSDISKRRGYSQSL